MIIWAIMTALLVVMGYLWGCWKIAEAFGDTIGYLVFLGIPYILVSIRAYIHWRKA